MIIISRKRQSEKITKYIWPGVLKKPFEKLQAIAPIQPKNETNNNPRFCDMTFH
jgi:hypothetical protein